VAKNPSDERLVYLALKNVFKGEGAQLHYSKKVREQFEKHLNEEETRTLITEHNIDNICNTAKRLLEKKIFSSTSKANIPFPEVFEVSPAQSAERSVSEEEAARSEVAAFEVAAERRQQTWTSNELELDIYNILSATKSLST
jgi:hypothetical protein